MAHWLTPDTMVPVHPVATLLKTGDSNGKYLVNVAICWSFLLELSHRENSLELSSHYHKLRFSHIWQHNSSILSSNCHMRQNQRLRDWNLSYSFTRWLLYDHGYPCQVELERCSDSEHVYEEQAFIAHSLDCDTWQILFSERVDCFSHSNRVGTVSQQSRAVYRGGGGTALSSQ